MQFGVRVYPTEKDEGRQLSSDSETRFIIIDETQ